MKTPVLAAEGGLQLRPTAPADLDFVLQAEAAEENRRFIRPWTRRQHLDALDNPDEAHLIIEVAGLPEPVGFLMLAGLRNANRSLEFRRIVISRKGFGYGRTAVKLVKQIAFEQHRAHRLWLDVKDFNHRARELYRRQGFVEEGILRQCLRNGDRYESLVVMSILEDEYRAV